MALLDAGLSPGLRDGQQVERVRAVPVENNRTRAGDTLLTRRQFGYIVRFSPTRRIAQVSVDGIVGEEIDFANARLGRGATVNLYARVNPTDHLELAAIRNERVLHVDDALGVERRLFVARVSRLRATYTFTARVFVRVIGSR